MEAGGGKAEQHVAFDDVVGRQQLAAFGGADGKAGEIVVAGAIHAGHFGGLAADQRAAGLRGSRRRCRPTIAAPCSGSSFPVAK